MLTLQLVVMRGFGLGLILILNVRFAFQSLACTSHLLSWLSTTALRRVLSLKMVTQCAMLEEYGIFLVLANKVKRPLVPYDAS